MKTSSLYFYTDRVAVDALPDDLCEEMKGHYLIGPDDSKISFCGLVITEKGVNVFLPRNSYPLPVIGSAEGYRYASLLMKGLKRYLQDKANLELNNDGEGSLGGLQLRVVFDLLDDYCTYGLYSRRFSEKVRNTGKPDWRQTMTSQVAFAGASGPVYLDIHGIRRRFISDCEVARIHAHVIRELDRTFSWIITESDISIAAGAEKIPHPVANEDAMITTLERELASVYSEREIRLMNLLIQYIKSTTSKDSPSVLIGLRHFHGMWEKMLDSALKWVFPVNSLLAIPAYRFNDGDIQPAAIKAQRTDTVMKRPDGKRFIVVDAKYYAAQGLSSAPGWGDIVKQFFYAKALNSFSEHAEVDNAFVFPGRGPLISVHMLDRKSECELDEQFSPIRCLYLEPMELLEHYVAGKKLTKLSECLMYPSQAES